MLGNTQDAYGISNYGESFQTSGISWSKDHKAWATNQLTEITGLASVGEDVATVADTVQQEEVDEQEQQEGEGTHTQIWWRVDMGGKVWICEADDWMFFEGKAHKVWKDQNKNSRNWN